MPPLDFSLTSAETGTEYLISVSTPEAPGPWPAVVIMDGNAIFAAALEAYRALPAGAVPPLLLVGVGYGNPSRHPANWRGRDYTPVHHSDEPSSGGGDAFLRFLTSTLWPELARRHAIDPVARGIAGHSLGSLLVLHALFQSQPFFTHHLACAPSIWWADRAILRQAAALRAQHPELPGKLFLGVGDADTASMTGDLALLETQLAATPFARLEIISRRFPGRNHYDVLPLAFAAGLAALFGAG